MKWIQTNKIPDENPDLPMDFKISPETKSFRLFSHVCDCRKEIWDLVKEN